MKPKFKVGQKVVFDESETITYDGKTQVFDIRTFSVIQSIKYEDDKILYGVLSSTLNKGVDWLDENKLREPTQEELDTYYE